MEQPYAGRAILNTHPNQIEITIPTKKNWLVIVFISFWMCGWTIGFFSAFTMLFSAAAPFILVWLCLWSVGGFFVINILVYMLFGKEVITVTGATISQSRKGQLFFRDKVYDIREAKSFRVKEPDDYYTNFLGFRRYDFFGMRSSGTIWFSYGMKTVKIAIGIDEPEAWHIIDRLKEKGLLTEGNF